MLFPLNDNTLAKQNRMSLVSFFSKLRGIMDKLNRSSFAINAKGLGGFIDRNSNIFVSNMVQFKGESLMEGPSFLLDVPQRFSSHRATVLLYRDGGRFHVILIQGCSTLRSQRSLTTC